MKPSHTQQRRGIYLLPNLFTTASLFAAFYSIVASLNHHFEVAVIAIFIGMIADGLDGRVARLTNTQTAFGAEYDSLSDMVTFGVAPSLVVYSWSLVHLGKVGWLASFVYTASVALRLARFNTQVSIVNKRYFQGLACPAGAAILASFVWYCCQLEVDGASLSYLVAIMTVIIALLMVSNIRYYSFKEIDVKRRVPFLYVLLMVLLFAAIAVDPAFVLFCAFVIYALSGPTHTVIRLAYVKRRRSKMS